MTTPQIIGIVVTVFIAWSGFLVGVIKYLLKHNTVDRSSQIEELKTEVTKLNDTIANLQQELALKYVRKSDFNRCRDKSLSEKLQLEKKQDDLVVKLYEKIDDLARELRYAKTQ